MPPGYGGCLAKESFNRIRLSAHDRGVAQLGSALRSGRRGRRFKSCHPDHFSWGQYDGGYLGVAGFQPDEIMALKVEQLAAP